MDGFNRLNVEYLVEWQGYTKTAYDESPHAAAAGWLIGAACGCSAIDETELFELFVGSEGQSAGPSPV